jgi:hypothetical protein
MKKQTFFCMFFTFFLLLPSYGANSKKGKSKLKRTISSITNEEQSIIEEINNKIISIHSSNQIEDVRRLIISQASKKGHEKMYLLNMYAALVRPLRLLKGIAWRLRGVVEDSGILHVNAVSAIKDIHYSEYMVGPHLKALVKYLVDPNLALEKFETMASVQEFLDDELYTVLNRSLTDFSKIVTSLPDKYQFDLDGYLLTGHQLKREDKSPVLFISDSKRFKKVIKPNLFYVQSTMKRVLGAIKYSYVYDFEDAMSISNAMMLKTALNMRPITRKILPNRLPNFMTPKDFVETIEKRKYGKFLTLRIKNKKRAQEYLDKSRSYFLDANKDELVAFNGSLNNSILEEGSSYLVNPRALYVRKERANRRLNEKIRMYDDMAASKSSFVTSETTGRQMEFNLAPLFTAHDDLKAFLPKTFLGNKEKRGDYLKENNKKVKHYKTGDKVFAWDYLYGRPNTWKDPTFGGLIPGATNKNLLELTRSLRQTASTYTFVKFLPIP